MADRIYAELVKIAENGERLTRYDMVSWCVGYYGKVDKKILEAINRLYRDNFID